MQILVASFFQSMPPLTPKVGAACGVSLYQQINLRALFVI